MRKLFIALVGLSMLGGLFASPAQAAPKHLSVVQQSGVKWTEAPKHLSAPSTMLLKSRTCSAADTGYSVTVQIDYVYVSGKVDVNSIYTQYNHRKLGLWTVEDWASSGTVTIQNAGNTWGSFTNNPSAKNRWYSASPAFTPNSMKAGLLKASGSGTSIGSCLVALP